MEMIFMDFRTGLEMAKLVRNGNVSSRELILDAYQRIAAQNKNLNAVVTLRKEKAIFESDHLTDTGQPFYGVPLLIKGLGQSLAGEPSTAGSVLLKDQIAAQTNFFVQALQRAGFIIIGQTNVPEFGFKNITDSELYGNAHNPWNLDYQPGGSSGGAAASVAAGFVPIAAGSDGGGSIRIPASFSGLIGLKPTRGRVPVGPADWRSWQGAAIDFGLTRDMDDTAALLDSLQTLQSAAVFQVPPYQPGFLQTIDEPLPKLKIAISVESPVGTPVSEEAKKAVHEVADVLEKLGHEVVNATPTLNGIELMETYYAMNAGETNAMFDDLKVAFGREIQQSEVEPLTWALGETGKHITAAQYSEALGKWDHAGYVMDQFLNDYDFLLTPTTAWPAPKVGDPLISPENQQKLTQISQFSPKAQQQLIYDQWLPALTWSPFTQQANLTGQPAISLPTHVTDEGLPLGVQFLAKKGNESGLLKIGKLLENEGIFKLKSM